MAESPAKVEAIKNLLYRLYQELTMCHLTTPSHTIAYQIPASVFYPFLKFAVRVKSIGFRLLSGRDVSPQPPASGEKVPNLMEPPT